MFISQNWLLLKYLHDVSVNPPLSRILLGDMLRVATTQGKQGIWLLTFPDRENTGNLVNLIFYTGKIVATQGKFRIF